MRNQYNPTFSKIIQNSGSFCLGSFVDEGVHLWKCHVPWGWAILSKLYTMHIVYTFFCICPCPCLGDDSAFNLIFMYSNSSHFTYHIFMRLGFTQITVHRIVISHHVSPPPATPCPSPQLWGYVWPTHCCVWCSDSSHHAMSENRRGGKSFFKHDCTIWCSDKINPFGTHHPLQKNKK